MDKNVMDKHKISLIFQRFQFNNPNPKIELNYTSPFELLVAVILSAQSTDKAVNKATFELFKVANTPQLLLDLGEERLKDMIKTIGLYNNKAKNLIKTCRMLIERYHTTVPQIRMDLESLPGVGRKTANVVLNTIFGHTTIGVDTHVFRVANRIGLVQAKTPLAVEQALLSNIGPEFIKHAHHWLVLHGRYICLAKRPRCVECIINDLCEYSAKTSLKIVNK